MTEPKKRKPRRLAPEKWLSGPDPKDHEMFTAWHKHRSQAHYRKEGYELTYEDFKLVWGSYELFKSRGRQPECPVLTRKDVAGPWSVSNCEIISRYEQLCRDNLKKAGKPRNKRRYDIPPV